MLVAQSYLTLCDPMDWNPPRSSVHGDSPGKNTGVGCHALLQGIFPIQGSNPGLPHCRWILYHLSHQRSPRIVEWGVCPFSRRSSWPGYWTRDSCIAGRYFTSWATREAHCIAYGFPSGASDKEPTCQCRRCKRCRFNLWVRKIPWRRARQPTQVFLPGESLGQRSRAGYTP